MTALVDQLESLGLAMDEGLISREEAVDLLVEFRQGGLTPLGAADMLSACGLRRGRATRRSGVRSAACRE